MLWNPEAKKPLHLGYWPSTLAAARIADKSVAASRSCITHVFLYCVQHPVVPMLFNAVISTWLQPPSPASQSLSVPLSVLMFTCLCLLCGNECWAEHTKDSGLKQELQIQSSSPPPCIECASIMHCCTWLKAACQIHVQVSASLHEWQGVHTACLRN